MESFGKTQPWNRLNLYRASAVCMVSNIMNAFRAGQDPSSLVFFTPGCDRDSVLMGLGGQDEDIMYGALIF